LRRIREKIRKKQTHSLAEEAPAESTRPKAQVIDLMEALKNSLRAKGKSSGRRAPARKQASRARA
jgi:non-homologous end joining protein Ku